MVQVELQERQLQVALVVQAVQTEAVELQERQLLQVQAVLQVQVVQAVHLALQRPLAHQVQVQPAELMD
jgi:hypothetical protein